MEALQAAVLETVADPQRIAQGSHGELIAVREVAEGRWLAAVYREIAADGFIVTAFVTRRARWFERREQLWP